MKNILLSSCVVFSLTAMNTPPADAGAMCGNRTKMLEALGNKFKEVPGGQGIVNQKAIAELYHAKGGTWSFIVTDTRGVSCVIASGSGWEEIKYVPFVPTVSH